MKTIRTFLLAFALVAVSIHAQVTPVAFKYALSNASQPFLLGGTAYTNLTAAHGAGPIEVWQGRGLSFCCRLVGNDTLTTTGLVGCAFAPSVDGTNYCNFTNQYIWVVVKPGGTTEQFSYTNIPAAVLDNCRAIKLVQITNNNCATNMVQYLTNIIIGVKN